MRRLLLSSLFVGLLFALSVSGIQQDPKPLNQFPTMLDFNCPKYSVPRTSSVKMIGEVVGTKQILGEKAARSVKYNWQVSRGEIQGQGTPRLVWSALANQVLSELEITLYITGAAPEIPHRSSCIIKFDPDCIEEKIGELRDDPNREESVLDAAAKRFKAANQRSILYVVGYAGRDACIWEGDWLSKRAKEYLVRKHNLDAARILQIEGGHRENWAVELLLFPAAKCGPLPLPSILPSDARMAGQCSAKFGERSNF